MRFFNWLNTFSGALFMACFCLFAAFLCLAGEPETQSPFIGWINVGCVLYWVWRAKVAMGTPKMEDELTDYKKDRIKTVVKGITDIMQEIDAELKASRLARKLKAKEKSE